MLYTVQPRTRRRAAELGLEARPSAKPDKKLDVFQKGKLIARVGAAGYSDYPTYLKQEQEGKVPSGTAEKRREAYHARHGQYPRKAAGQYTAGYLAGELLW